jgi:hypothetical protein
MILRILVFAIAGLEALAGAAFAIVLFANTSDPLGRNIAIGVGTITAIPLVLGTLPALTLAVLDRWLPLALVLALAAVPAWLLLMRIA